MAAAMHDKHWWPQPLSPAFEDPASNPGGLSEAEAAARLERFGPNWFRDRTVQSPFLPFLAMTAAQILLNNMHYDISEVPIPLDRVDDAETRAPRRLDITSSEISCW